MFAANQQRLLDQQDALKQSEDKLNSILNSVEAYIYIKGRDYTYHYANRQVCELFGRSYFRSEFVGRRQWLDDARYADLVSLCQFLPGPASSLDRRADAGRYPLKIAMSHAEIGAHLGHQLSCWARTPTTSAICCRV